MSKPMPLGEVSVLTKLPPDWREGLRPYLEAVNIKQVEVYPKTKKWVVHLYTPQQLDSKVLEPLAEILKENAPGIEEIAWCMEYPQEILSLEKICAETWDKVIFDLGEILPATRGWLGSKYEVNEDTLLFFVPNALGVEYFRVKQAQVEQYFYHTFGLRVHVSCALDPGQDELDHALLTELEEQEFLQQIIAAEPKEEKSKEKPKSSLILGREFKDEPVHIKTIQDEERQVSVAGRVFGQEYRKLKSGRQLLTFNITDKTDSVSAKIFLEENVENLDFQDGEWIRFRGPVQYDKFSSELTLMPKDVMRTSPVIREDKAEEKRIELHLHTRMSTMDGVSSAAELIRRAGQWGHEALAVTDHGVVQAFPEAVEAGQKHGVKVILGVEGYLIDDTLNGQTPLSQLKSRHIVLLVRDATGLKNLYKLITRSHLEYFHRRPRIPKSLLASMREGLLVGSACEAGELIQAILAKEPWDKLLSLSSFYDYLEIQPIGNNAFMLRNGQVADEDGLRELNRTVLRLGKELNKPVVATGDVHFLDPEDEAYRRILMAGKGFEDADQQAPLYFRTTDDMLDEFAYLGTEDAFETVVRAPKYLAGLCQELKPFPDDLFSPTIPGAEDKIQTMSWQRAHELYGPELPEIVRKRLEKELNSIIGHGFSVLYLIAHLLVKKSNDDGYLVGSRGSVGSSFVATMTGITEVNPLPPHYRCRNKECLHSVWVEDGSVGSGADLPDKDCPKCGNPMVKDGHDIPFETFLGFKGDKVPDIDLNFSGDYQPRAHKFTEELFGKDNVFRAGTIATIADKTAYGYVKNYLEEHHVKARTAEMSRLVEGCTGVKRTTGQHPGGLMVVPKECDVYDFTPLQRPADDPKSETITTHFDYHSISGRLVKLDILGHDDPTVIKMLEDLTGVNAKGISLDDQETLSLFSRPDALGVTTEDIRSSTGTLGIPEFGTKFVRQMLEDTQPKSFSDLVRISGLSHGTDVWLGNAQDLVRSGTATISEIIACRDDIMVYLIYKGLEPGRAFKIMEGVRKGKGLKAEDIEEMRSHDVPEWYIESCQKIKYMFPKAHAVAYVTMAFRIAWFKINYPEAFYATFFSVRADEFDIEIIGAGLEACKQKIKEIEDKGNEATAKEKNLVTILELAVELACRGIRLRPVDLLESDATKFQITPQGLLPPFVAIQGLGESAARNLVALRESKGILSIEDLRTQAKLSKTIIDILGKQGCLNGLPEENQLRLFM